MSATEARGRFEVKNARGLHARAATKLAQVATRFPCEVEITGPDGQVTNAKSIMGVLLLVGAKGTVLEVVARGEGADEAIAQIGVLFEARFGESE